MARTGEALVSLLQRPGGSVRTVIRLQPAELGRLEVRIERPRGGGATVSIQVEKATTLHLLRGDSARLEQALDAAGVPAGGRGITFSLAPPAHVADHTGLAAPTETRPSDTAALDGSRADAGRAALAGGDPGAGGAGSRGGDQGFAGSGGADQTAASRGFARLTGAEAGDAVPAAAATSGIDIIA